MRAIIVDLPAFGKPTRPTSASSFSSSRRSLISPGFARLHLARRAIGGGREARVAHAAASALATRTRWPSSERSASSVGSVCLGVDGLFVDQRADRHRELEVACRRAPRAVRAHAVLAALGVEQRMEPEVDEGVDVRAGDDIHRPAVTAVAAARAAARDELLAAERETTASAVRPLQRGMSTSSTNNVTRVAGC